MPAINYSTAQGPCELYLPQCTVMAYRHQPFYLWNTHSWLVLIFIVFIIAFIHYLSVTPGHIPDDDISIPPPDPSESTPLLSESPKSTKRTRPPTPFYTIRKVSLIRETTKEQHKALYCSRCKKPCYLICFCGQRGLGDAAQGWLEGEQVGGCPGCGRSVFKGGNREACQCWQERKLGEEVDPENIV